MADLVASRLLLQEQAFGKFQDKWLADPQQGPFFGQDPRTMTDADALEDLANWSENVFTYSQPRPAEVLAALQKKETRVALVQNPNFPVDTTLARLVMENPEAFFRGNPAVRSLTSNARFWKLFGQRDLQTLLRWSKEHGYFKQLFGAVVEELTFKTEISRQRDLGTKNTSQVVVPKQLIISDRGLVMEFDQQNTFGLYKTLADYARASGTTEAWLRRVADKK